jgi:hypothetical protein
MRHFNCISSNGSSIEYICILIASGIKNEDPSRGIFLSLKVAEIRYISFGARMVPAKFGAGQTRDWKYFKLLENKFNECADR